MSNSEIHVWQNVYVSAVLEKDLDRLPGKITEAQHAIEHRLREVPSPDGIEYNAIKAAWKTLANLRTERHVS